MTCLRLTGAIDDNLARKINEQMLFHASNRDALAAICAHGFDARLWRSERYGKVCKSSCLMKPLTQCALEQGMLCPT